MKQGPGEVARRGAGPFKISKASYIRCTLRTLYAVYYRTRSGTEGGTAAAAT